MGIFKRVKCGWNKCKNEYSLVNLYSHSLKIYV